MENKENKISAAMIVEAMEQVRMAFTASRIGFGAATLLQPLCKKDEKWCKKFMKIQNEYHSFLLGCYQDFEVEAARAEEAESKEASEASEEKKDDNMFDGNYDDARIDNPHPYKG